MKSKTHEWNSRAGVSGQTKSVKKRDPLAHWAWTIPILLLIAALSIRQLDLYYPETSEFYPMFVTGWLNNKPNSPIDIIADLYATYPEHVPGFFLLLSLWGQFTGLDIATGRLLSGFFGLLAMAMAFRLAKDFVAPGAGLLAIIIVASNAFFNFYLAHARMYTLMFFLSVVVLWLFLRIVHQTRAEKTRDYLALFASVYTLVNVHVFSILMLAALGLYHLIIIPKNRKWWKVSLAVCAALLLFSPYLTGTLTQGVQQSVELWEHRSADGPEAIRNWLTVISNGQPGLLLLSAMGLTLGLWKRKIPSKPAMLLIPLFFLAALALMAQLTKLVVNSSMRHHLAGWMPCLLFITAGLCAFYSFRKPLGLLLVLLWILAGLHFQQTANWRDHLAGARFTPFASPPFQAISRLAARTEPKPHIIGLPYHPRMLDWPKYLNYTLHGYYFDLRDINLKLTFNVNAEALETYLRHEAGPQPSLWLFYQTSVLDAEDVALLDSAAIKLDYRLCDTVHMGKDTVIRQYTWIAMDCATPTVQSSSQTDSITYRFYGAEFDESDSKLYFSDSWTSRDGARLNNIMMSHQLISADWNNVAQLDLPLVHEDAPRQFYLDAANAPSGSYRLMAILYDKHTGLRFPWLDNDSELPYMLNLTEVIIPE